MFLNILSTLNSFQIIPHVSIPYYKPNHLNTLRFYNVNTILTLKLEKPSMNYICCDSFICGCTFVE
jgi:hypothetical protein